MSSEEIQQGYARKMAIFVALNPNKPGKFGMVWDAASRSHYESLNDFIICCPHLLSLSTS